ncbi:MAG: hypothetical protein KDD40_10950, partial [Bdellovibrionales bacterium]|nr:hypothetical protein [Bdellovibrionales bacterium]
TKNDIIELAKKKGIKLHDDHPVPTTRREFLAQGLMGFAGYMVAPSLLHLISTQAHAQSVAECTTLLTPDLTMPGFLHLNLSGGAGLTGQWAVRKIADPNRPLATRNNEDNLVFLSNYRSLGLGANSGAFNRITNQFANPFQVVESDGDTGAQLFKRMRDIAATACANTSATGVAVASQDDTGSNNKFGPQGIIHAVQKAKEIKFRIAQNLSNRSGTALTGVNQDVAGRNRPYAPIVANSLNDILRVIGQAPSSETESGANIVLNDDEKKKMLEVINNLSGSQARNVASIGSANRENFVKLYQEASGKSYCQLIVPQASVDPYENTEVASLWQTQIQGSFSNLSNDADRVKGIASLVHSAVNGWAGTVGINLGGYDYHGNNRNATDPRDGDAGLIIGGALKTAEILNKPLFILVTSDGATGAQSSDNRFANWASDRGNGGCMLAFMFDPRNATGQSKAGYLATVDSQIGHYSDGQAASDNTLVGDPERATMAVIHRYLAFSEFNDWKTVVQALDDRAGFTAAELQYIAKFGA